MGSEVGDKFHVPIRAPKESMSVRYIHVPESVFVCGDLVKWEGQEGIYCIKALDSRKYAHLMRMVLRTQGGEFEIDFGEEEKNRVVRYPVPVSFLRKLHRGEIRVIPKTSLNT